MARIARFALDRRSFIGAICSAVVAPVARRRSREPEPLDESQYGRPLRLADHMEWTVGVEPANPRWLVEHRAEATRHLACSVARDIADAQLEGSR